MTLQWVAFTRAQRRLDFFIAELQLKIAQHTFLWSKAILLLTVKLLTSLGSHRKTQGPRDKKSCHINQFSICLSPQSHFKFEDLAVSRQLTQRRRAVLAKLAVTNINGQRDTDHLPSTLTSQIHYISSLSQCNLVYLHQRLLLQ